jgi:hypothetical protein
VGLSGRTGRVGDGQILRHGQVNLALLRTTQSVGSRHRIEGLYGSLRRGISSNGCGCATRIGCVNRETMDETSSVTEGRKTQPVCGYGSPAAGPKERALPRQ